MTGAGRWDWVERAMPASPEAAHARAGPLTFASAATVTGMVRWWAMPQSASASTPLGRAPDGASQAAGGVEMTATAVMGGIAAAVSASPGRRR